MSATRIALKPVKLNLEKLRPLVKEIFANYGERFAKEAEENPELLITSLLLRIAENLSEPGGSRILVEGALFEESKKEARALIEQK
jgi:hypothetical protein